MSDYEMEQTDDEVENEMVIDQSEEDFSEEDEYEAEDNDSSESDDEDEEEDDTDIEEIFSFASEDEDMEEDFSVAVPKHLRCASHTLNLVGSTDFKIAIKKSSMFNRHTSAFRKCKILWKANKHHLSSEIIMDTLKGSLIYPTVTRWNALYDAVVRLISFEKKDLNKVMKLLKNLKYKRHIDEFEEFTVADINYLKIFINIMKPVAIALDSLQGEKTHYYGILLPTLFKLRSQMNETITSLSNRYKKIAKLLLESIESRFSNFFNFADETQDAILATCFHPKYKLKFFEKHCSKEQFSKFFNLCIKAIKHEHTFIKAKLDKNSELDDEEPCLKLPKSDDDFLIPMFKKQMDLFIKDKDVSLLTLEKYASIESCFIRYNTHLSTSGPIERIFSLTNYILNNKRSSLTDSMFEKLIFLKENKKFIQY